MCRLTFAGGVKPFALARNKTLVVFRQGLTVSKRLKIDNCIESYN